MCCPAGHCRIRRRREPAGNRVGFLDCFMDGRPRKADIPFPGAYWSTLVKMSFRWFGDSDPVSLQYIRQIPGMHGIVSAVYDVPVGEVWPVDKIQALKAKIEAHDLALDVIESVPVHEDIKLGKPSRDRLIANYQQTVRNLGACGIKVICYNFMPVFDWTRTSLAKLLPDGSTTLTFSTKEVDAIDVSKGISLPGWYASSGARGAFISRICATSRSMRRAISRRPRTNRNAVRWTWRQSSKPIMISAMKVMPAPIMDA